VNGRTFQVAGWAIDFGAPTGTGVKAVHVWAFPSAGGSGIFLGAATYGISRPDVGAAFGNNKYTPSGFQLTTTSLPTGNYRITAYMQSDVTGTFNLEASAVNVIVGASLVQGNIEAPATGIRPRPFGMWGWAADTGASSGTGIDVVHVWAFPISGAAPIFVGAATYGQSRPDIGSYLGNSQFNNSGFSIMVTSANLPTAGIYDLHVYARSTVTGAFTDLRAVRVAVP
jgi:hypothetical protein